MTRKAPLLALLALSGCFSAQPIDSARYSCNAQIDCESGFVCYEGYCCKQDRATGLCVDHPCIKNGTDADHDGFPVCAGDCDDSDPTRFPGATEVCDGKDNNCDGQVDEGLGVTRYRDADGDGHGSSAPDGVVVVCGGQANGPNLSTTSDDCDDSDPRRFGGNPEVCDGVDNDCNGQIDDGATSTFFKDQDGDGYGRTDSPIQACAAPEGYAAQNGDCQDQSAFIHPGATEVCNGFDDDCNGLIDEGVKQAFYPDNDSDGFGRADGGSIQDCTPSLGYAANNSDCDDTNPLKSPNAAEVCNGEDDNCNGAIDEGVKTAFYRDGDGDQFGTTVFASGGRVFSCQMPDAGYVTRSGDCNDAAPTVHPGAPEVCDGVDNDCNGLTDEGVLQTFWRDADSDGYGDAKTPVQACSAPLGNVANLSDCDDSSANSYPGAPELCDGKDNNCDGVKDNSPTCGPKVDQAEDAALWGAQSSSLGPATATVSGCVAGTGNASDITRVADASVKVAGNASIRADGFASDFFLYYPVGRNGGFDLTAQQLTFEAQGDAASWQAEYHQPVVLFCGPTGWARYEPPANLTGTFSRTTLTIPPNTSAGNGYTYGGTFSWSRVDWVEVHVNNAGTGNTSLWVDDFRFVTP